MHPILVVFFIVLGLADFLYGLFFDDRLSVLAGPLIIAVTIYIAKFRKK
jgi:hypothetical protein